MRPGLKGKVSGDTTSEVEQKYISTGEKELADKGLTVL